MTQKPAENDISSQTLDPFFEVIGDANWNACIGRQGTEENYVDGYMEAALVLVEAVIEKRLMASRDTLAMPILYTCRHGLELALKFVIERLLRTQMLTSSHRMDHDIMSHWRHLNDAQLGDAALAGLIAELEPFVASLAHVDDDGQELRYAQNREGEKSLGDVAVVNLPHIRDSIRRLSELLSRLKHRVQDVEDERLTGAHTKECSRADLMAIAKMLGDHSTWSHAGFDERKAAVRERFGLSNRKFSDAVDAIRASRPLAASIGIETDLVHISDEKALEVMQLWSNANPPKADNPEDLGTEYLDRDWDAFMEGARRAQELDKAALRTVTVEELSDLEVLFYLGRDRVHGEHYDAEVERTAAKNRRAGSPVDAVHHLMSKMNLFEAVLAGAAAAGRPSLSEKVRSLRAPAASCAEQYS